MKRLEYLSTRLGKSKAQVVKDAIDKLYEEYGRRSSKTAFDRLLEGGFEPLAIQLEFNAADEDKQRRIIRAKIAKKRRR